MKKKILIISLDYYPGDVGGAEVALKSITDRIAPENIEFHLITMRYDTNMSKVEQIDNVLVHRIGFGKLNPTIAERRKFPLHYNKHLFQFTAAFKAMQLQRKYGYDAVWGMMAHSCGVPTALFKILNPKVKMIMTLQEGDPPEYIESTMRPLWPLFKRAFTKADIIQVISSFLGDWAKRMGHPHEPVLIPNGVNAAHFTKPVAPEKIAETQQKIGKTLDNTFLITTSRIVHKNGLDDVVAALPHLPESVHFLIFGDGPDKEKLQTMATELGVADRVHFGGLISHDVMPAYLKACDIFIRPSRSEGMGNSFIEAMAARIPVIATQEGGIRDFLFDAKRNSDKSTTGWAVDSNQPEQIALAVKDILENPDNVPSIIDNAYQLATTQYDWDLIARRMKDEVFDVVLK